MNRFASITKFKVAAIAVAAGLFAIGGAVAPADAGLVVNFRFADGSLTKNVGVLDAGSTIQVDVWASVTGSAAGAEGFQAMYFGAQTQELTTEIDGDITARSILTPFTATGNSAGTLQELSYAPGGSDGQTDLGGTALNTSTGWARPYAGLGTFVTTGGQTIENGVEFRVATLTYSASTILPLLTGEETTALRIYPILPSTLLAGTRATWQQDGQSVNAGTASAGGYSTGTGVEFVAVAAVPEPATIGLAAAAAAMLLGRRRRQA